jgi:molybdopterin synthase catalytic subunit
MPKFGFSEAEWQAAKAEAKQVLIERAKARDTISYSELVRRIRLIELEAHDPRLNELLMEISSEEDAAGRGMLTAIVVHRSGDMHPGPGFFELARRLGRDTSDVLKCWIDELKKVHAYWSKSEDN